MREDRRHRAALADHGTARAGRPYLSSAALTGQEEARASEASAESIVRSFISAWNRNDMLAVLDHLAEEVCYHNIPMEPLVGKAAVARFLDALGPIDSVDWTLHNIAAKGDVVMTERTDRFIVGDKRVEIAVMGTFEIDDGKIMAWRDYFDLASFSNQFSAPSAQPL